MPGVKEQVERQAVFLQHFEAGQHRGADDEVVVRLVLRHVPHADEFRLGLEFGHLLGAIVAGQINPADDAENARMPCGQAEHPAVLAHVVLRLDENRTIDARPVQVRLQVSGQVIAPDGGQLGTSSQA